MHISRNPGPYTRLQVRSAECNGTASSFRSWDTSMHQSSSVESPYSVFPEFKNGCGCTTSICAALTQPRRNLDWAHPHLRNFIRTLISFLTRFADLWKDRVFRNFDGYSFVFHFYRAHLKNIFMLFKNQTNDRINALIPLFCQLFILLQ